jgi:hypothetical protein
MLADPEPVAGPPPRDRVRRWQTVAIPVIRAAGQGGTDAAMLAALAGEETPATCTSCRYGINERT